MTQLKVGVIWKEGNPYLETNRGKTYKLVLRGTGKTHICLFCKQEQPSPARLWRITGNAVYSANVKDVRFCMDCLANLRALYKHGITNQFKPIERES